MNVIIMWECRNILRHHHKPHHLCMSEISTKNIKWPLRPGGDEKQIICSGYYVKKKQKKQSSSIKFYTLKTASFSDLNFLSFEFLNCWSFSSIKYLQFSKLFYFQSVNQSVVQNKYKKYPVLFPPLEVLLIHWEQTLIWSWMYLPHAVYF